MRVSWQKVTFSKALLIRRIRARGSYRLLVTRTECAIYGLCHSASQRDNSAEWISYMREPCTLIIFLIKIQFFCFVNRIIFINFASGSLYLFKPAFPLEIINHIYIVKPTANQSLRMMMTRRYDIGRTPFVREDIANTPPHSLITYISVIYIDSIGSRQSCRERCCIYLPSDGEA